MYFIVDSKIYSEAIESLKRYGKVITISSKNITYDTISGHPDIFICSTPNNFIVAKNTPIEITNRLQKLKIPFSLGKSDIKTLYPNTCHYNAVITDKYFIHNLKYTDKKILDSYSTLEKIHVEQGYTRCNLLPLKDDHFITSDKGIHSELLKRNLHVLLVCPEDIVLSGFKHGFFGGCCGVYKDIVFIHGSLTKFNDGLKVRLFLEKLNYTIIELCDAPLQDCGSILIK